MSAFDRIDWFNDLAVHQDPYPYYEFLRSKGPATLLPKHNVVAVTGYNEVLSVFRDDERYSAANAVTGPFPPLPFKPEGEDITAQIEAHRHLLPQGGLIMTMDRPRHTPHRSLLMGLITPRRLKENEEFMWRLADQRIDKFLERGSFDAVEDLGQPLATLVVADLLGVPESDHKRFADMFAGTVVSQVGVEPDPSFNPLVRVGEALAGYVVDRRSNPRSDVLTGLALAKFPDGSTPEISDVVSVGAFLFAAGQDTTVRLVSSALRIMCEDPQLQKMLRQDRGRITPFIEEVLRIESPTKADFRLSRTRINLGGIEIPPATTVMMMIGAANRDPIKFERPTEFIMDRRNVMEHLAFGRGIHACAGAPLARAETRVALHRLLDRTSDIRISEAKHGAPGARRYEFQPTYILRGTTELHLDITPA